MRRPGHPSRLLVPLIHGVDCLGQLSAAGLVDTASADPYVIECSANNQPSGTCDFDVALLERIALFFLSGGFGDDDVSCAGLTSRQVCDRMA